ncbi:hypothetical protein C9F11_46675 (plasmid) [Streptomyces sp. YIM 121038]|nr:hypothetical protein C9F11_46675 [Streptomyces sp. YIM 121038]
MRIQQILEKARRWVLERLAFLSAIVLTTAERGAAVGRLVPRRHGVSGPCPGAGYTKMIQPHTNRRILPWRLRISWSRSAQFARCSVLQGSGPVPQAPVLKAAPSMRSAAGTEVTVRAAASSPGEHASASLHTRTASHLERASSASPQAAISTAELPAADELRRLSPYTPQNNRVDPANRVRVWRNDRPSLRTAAEWLLGSDGEMAVSEGCGGSGWRPYSEGGMTWMPARVEVLGRLSTLGADGIVALEMLNLRAYVRYLAECGGHRPPCQGRATDSGSVRDPFGRSLRSVAAVQRILGTARGATRGIGQTSDFTKAPAQPVPPERLYPPAMSPLLPVRVLATVADSRDWRAPETPWAWVAEQPAAAGERLLTPGRPPAPSLVLATSTGLRARVLTLDAGRRTPALPPADAHERRFSILHCRLVVLSSRLAVVPHRADKHSAVGPNCSDYHEWWPPLWPCSGRVPPGSAVAITAEVQAMARSKCLSTADLAPLLQLLLTVTR